MNNELKVSFYIKREKSATNTSGIYPIIGKIILRSTKLDFHLLIYRVLRNGNKQWVTI